MRRIPLWFLLVIALLLGACRQTPPPVTSLALTATVGTVADVCAEESEITLVENGPHTVYYCYTIENTGVVTIAIHDLADDLFGVILRGFDFVLAPGASVDTVAAGLTLATEIGATTTNAAIWDGFRGGARVASAEADTTVTIVPPDPPEPTAQYWAAAGTFAGDSNSGTIGAFSGNILYIGVRDFDDEPIAEPIVVDITVPGMGTLAYTFDPDLARDGVIALILADFEKDLAPASLGSLGFPVDVMRVPPAPELSTSAAVGGDFVFAFPDQTLVVPVDAGREVTVPTVVDVFINTERDRVSVEFVEHDDLEIAYQVDVFGRGDAAVTGFEWGEASPVVVDLSGPLGLDESYVVDVVALKGELEPFGPPAQIDIAEYLFYSE